MVKRAVSIVLAATFCVSGNAASSSAGQEYVFEPLTFLPTIDGKFESVRGDDSVRFEIGNPNSVTNPTLWDSAITISDAGSGIHCQTRNFLIEAVYQDKGNQVVAVVHDSGSSIYVSLIDYDCKALWPTKKFSAQSVTIKNDKILAMPICVPLKSGGKRCSPAEVYRLSTSSGLVFDAEASRALTGELRAFDVQRSEVLTTKHQNGKK